jgi:hypothetical protein
MPALLLLCLLDPKQVQLSDLENSMKNKLLTFISLPGPLPTTLAPSLKPFTAAPGGGDPPGAERAGAAGARRGLPGRGAGRPGAGPERGASDLDGANGFSLNGIAAGDISLPVSGAGDVNGDGFDDIIIGANGAGPNGGYSGQSYVVVRVEHGLWLGA